MAMVVSAVVALVAGPAPAEVTRPSGATSGPWAATVDGASDQVIRDVAVAPDGGIYVVGHSRTAGVAEFRQGTRTIRIRGEGRYSSFIAAYTAGGVLRWVRGIDSPGVDLLGGVAVAPNGTVAAVGTFEQSVVGPNGRAVPSLFGGVDAFVATWTPAGRMTRLTVFGGDYDDNAENVAFDRSGGLIVAATTSLPVQVGRGPTALRLPNGQSSPIPDAGPMIARIRPNGTPDWVVHDRGGSVEDLLVGGDGSVTVSGPLGSYSRFGTDDEDGPYIPLSTPGYVLRYSATGQFEWVAAAVQPDALVAGPDGAVDVLGAYGEAQPWGAVGRETWTTPEPGGGLYLARLADDGALSWIRRIGRGGSRVQDAERYGDELVVATSLGGYTRFGDPSAHVDLSAQRANAVAAYSSDGAVRWAARLPGTYSRYGIRTALQPGRGRLLVAGEYNGTARFGERRGAISRRSTIGFDGFLAPVDVRNGSDPVAPGAPRGLTAVAGDGRVALDWVRPGDGGADLTQDIRRDGAVVATVDGSVDHWVDDDVDNGTALSYRVVARNEAGTSAPSDPADVTPAATPRAWARLEGRLGGGGHRLEAVSPVVGDHVLVGARVEEEPSSIDWPGFERFVDPMEGNAGVITAYGRNGIPRWTTTVGGPGSAHVVAIDQLPDGEAVALLTVDTFVPMSVVGQPDVELPAGVDVFVVRLAPDGDVRWVAGGYGAGADPPTTASLSPDGGVTLLGAGGGDVVTADGQRTELPGTDSVVVHLTPEGALAWTRNVAGSTTVDTAPDGTVVIGGGRPLFGWGNHDPHNLGTWEENRYSDQTGFVAGLAGDDGAPQWVTPVRSGGTTRAVGPDEIVATDDGVVAAYSTYRVVAAPDAAGTDVATPDRTDQQVVLLALDGDGAATHVTTIGGISRDEYVDLAPAPSGVSTLVRLESNSTVTGPGGTLTVSCVEPPCHALVDLDDGGDPVSAQSWTRPTWHPVAVAVDDAGDRFVVGSGDGFVTFFEGTPDETTFDFDAGPPGSSTEVLAWFPAG
jgi:hypothetical protein